MSSLYPHEPGWKGRATSQAAAEGIAPRAKSLRARVYDALRDQPGSPEQVADRLGEPVMNCRPRFSELAARNLIEPTGRRAEAMGGRQAIIWQVRAQP